jgi:hypothetical protein
MKENRNEIVFAGLLAVLAIATRLVFNYLHVFNFNAVMATAFFAGATLSRKKLAMLIPLGAMLLTDMYLGFYDWRIMATVYGAFALVIFIGSHYAEKPSLLSFVVSLLGGSMSFFLLTNFAVWLFGDGMLYAHTTAGLVQCFAMGIPFYRNTLLGDITFSTALFGGLALYRYRVSTVQRVIA